MYSFIKYSPLLTTPIFLVFLIGCSSSDDKLTTYLERAAEYEKSGNLDAAEIELKNAIRIDQGNAEAFDMLSRIYFGQGSIRKSLPVLTKALEINPENEEAKWRMAEISMTMGDSNKSRDLAKSIMMVNPSHTMAPLIFANASIRLNETANAKIILKDNKQSEINSPSINTALGILLASEKDFEGAQALFDLALRSDPFFSQAIIASSNLHLFQGDIDKAISILEELATGEEPEPAAILRLARLYFTKKELKKGLEMLRLGIERHASHFGILETLAQALADQKEYAESEKHVQSILRRDPYHFNAMVLQGKLQLANGDVENAKETFAILVEMYPKSGDASYNQALAYLANQELAMAIASLTKTTTLDPNHSEAVIALAGLNARQGDAPGAIISLTGLLNREPATHKARILLAQILQEDGQYDDALAAYEHLAQSFPTNPQFQVQIGDLYLRKGDEAGARESFANALKQNALHPTALERLIDLDLRAENGEQAAERIDTLLQENQGSPLLHALKAKQYLFEKNLAEAESSLKESMRLQASAPAAKMLSTIYLKENRIGEAQEILKQLAELNPSDFGSQLILASTFEKEEKMDEAKAVYEKILEANPRYGPALNNLAYILSEEGVDNERAFELAKRAREELPDDPSTADTLGWIAYKNGEYDWAVSLLSESSRKLQHPEVHYHYAMALQKKGDTEEARTALNKAIELGLEEPKIAEARTAMGE